MNRWERAVGILVIAIAVLAFATMEGRFNRLNAELVAANDHIGALEWNLGMTNLDTATLGIRDVTMSYRVRNLEVADVRSEFAAEMKAANLIIIRWGDVPVQEVLVNGTPAGYGLFGNSYTIPAKGSFVSLEGGAETLDDVLPGEVVWATSSGGMAHGPIEGLGPDMFFDLVCNSHPMWQPSMPPFGGMCPKMHGG